MLRRLVIVLAAILVPVSQAGNVTLDGSFGGTPQALTGPSYSIPASLGKTVGHNLFHSFGQFDLNTGDVATFSGPGNVQIKNVLARVTGGGSSSIDGTIRTDPVTLAGANFFLINPFGVMFKSNAKVDVSGSFVVTTANYIKLADGGRFDAGNPVNDILTAAPPSAFGFLGPTPAAVTFQGQGGLNPPPPMAQVPDGKSIAVIAGDIQMANVGLSAPGGRVALVSVGSAGQVVLDVDDVLSPVVTTSFQQLGNIQLSDNSLIDASGQTGGRVVVSADNATLADGSIIKSFTLGPGNGLGVEVRVRNTLTLLNGGSISTFTIGSGGGGTIDVAAKSVVLDGQTDLGGFGGSGMSTDTGAAGKAGDIVIRATSLDVENGATIEAASDGPGDGGNMSITASSIHMDGHGFAANLSAITLEGKAGSIIVDADSLQMANGAEITTDTYSPAAAGRIQISASTVRLDGNGDADSGITTGIFSRTNEGATGPGGDIVIRSHPLDIVNGAMITVSSATSGDAGNIDIKSTSLLLDTGGSIQSAATAEGAAGGISISAKGSVSLSGGSFLSTSSAQTSGGDVMVSADTISLADSSITAQAAQNGGNIKLAALSSINVMDSTLFAQATTDGGNITLGTPFFIFLPNFRGMIDPSTISANADPLLGIGGNIKIGQNFTISADSLPLITATGAQEGNVTIGEAELDLSGSLGPLPGTVLDAESKLRERCAVRLAGGISSFIVVGRGGVPIDPEGFKPSLELKGREKTR